MAAFQRLGQFVALSCIFILTSGDHVYKYPQCEGNTAKTIKAYWINVETKVDRARVMQSQLNRLRIPNQRISGTTLPETYVLDGFRDFRFKRKELENFSSDKKKAKYIVDHVFGWNDTVKEGGYDNTNSPKELACFMSHLKAVHTAVHDDHCGNYALIYEDDLHLAHIINFPALIKSAPDDFGILQLFTNNPASILSMAEEAFLQPNVIWKLRLPVMKYWSAGAYIIDKIKWGPVIDKLVYIDDESRYHFSIIAGNKTSCMPKMCCKDNEFVNELPCFAAEMGYQADAIIYEYLKAYILRLPVYNLWPKLATNSSVQDVSSSHLANSRNEENMNIYYAGLQAFHHGENGTLKYHKNLFRRRKSH